MPTEDEQREIDVKTLKIHFDEEGEFDFSKYELHDNTYSPRGWQYKKYGNSIKGKTLLDKCRAEMIKVEDGGKCARNDSDPRYYAKETLKDDNMVIRISTSPSRSGNSCTYSVIQLVKGKNV